MMNRIAIYILLVITYCFLSVSYAGIIKEKITLFDYSTLHNPEKIKALLMSGAKVDAVDEYGSQAIHRAAEYGSPEAMKILLSAGANVDATDKSGRQPLSRAVAANNIETIRTLLSAGAKVDVDYPLHIAGAGGYGERDCRGNSKAENASKSYVDLVQLLLAAGSKVDAVNKNGDQPIHLSARKGNLVVTKALIAAGARVDAVDANGDQPLHWAARYGNAETAKILLSAGAKVDAVDANGDQPLHWAARYGNYGNTEIAKVLLAAGAKRDIPNMHGDSPNAIAKHIGPTESDKGNLKGNLDEATHNFLNNSIEPILFRAKLCSSSNGPNSCYGNDIIFCMQSNLLHCSFYGISDENTAKEIALSFQNSGLRIRKVTFWRNIYKKKTFFDKPIYEYKGDV